MNTRNDEFASNAGGYANAFGHFLDEATLKGRAPAVFAPAAHERTSPSYAFLSTQKLIDALSRAGFRPVAASQSATRVMSPLHARHVVRLRRAYETVELRDSIPELVLTNSHDGSSAYLMLIGSCHHPARILGKSRAYRSAGGSSAPKVTDGRNFLVRRGCLSVAKHGGTTMRSERSLLPARAASPSGNWSWIRPER